MIPFEKTITGTHTSTTKMKSAGQPAKNICNSVTTVTGTPHTTDIHRTNTLRNNSTWSSPAMELSASTDYKFARWYTSWVSTMNKQCLLKDHFQ